MGKKVKLAVNDSVPNLKNLQKNKIFGKFIKINIM